MRDNVYIVGTRKPALIPSVAIAIVRAQPMLGGLFHGYILVGACAASS